jgi:hypothetical protein
MPSPGNLGGCAGALQSSVFSTLRSLNVTTVVTRRSAASRYFKRGRSAICANSLLGPPDRSRGVPRCRNGNASMYSKGSSEAEVGRAIR